ncbi:hypothetical protein [Oceanirhabdus sp. W0125-5]|uniref:hypothetical protein n=1 Tax=Oceanirhabdus sp. W0125-5 TaxID=2999116 RepID=UPI0022F3365B|nr:hypothetical protein [Oceanirhabdus sp. W0125-5]WBW95688.1 hypothetical protein OW730_18590 [Oceanirhabdus sp. W0125-5]
MDYHSIGYPKLFFKAEEEANLKRKRPAWYLWCGIIGLIILVILWVEAFRLQLVSVWILTAIFTLGSLKAIGIVFFYEKFSGGVSKLVGNMQVNKKSYWTMVATRAVLFLVLSFATLYFAGYFGTIY